VLERAGFEVPDPIVVVKIDVFKIERGGKTGPA
jgi:hypothetical protein